MEAEDSEGTSVSSEEHVKKKVTFQESAQSPAKRQKSRRRSIEQLARKPSSGAVSCYNARVSLLFLKLSPASFR